MGEYRWWCRTRKCGESSPVGSGMASEISPWFFRRPKNFTKKIWVGEAFCRLGYSQLAFWGIDIQQFHKDGSAALQGFKNIQTLMTRRISEASTVLGCPRKIGKRVRISGGYNPNNYHSTGAGFLKPSTVPLSRSGRSLIGMFFGRSNHTEP